MKTKLSIHFLLLACALGLAFSFSSCEKQPDENLPNITVILGKNGKGNNDYAALIYKAIQKWENNPNVNMTIYEPQSKEEAADIYKNWAVESVKYNKALMIPANGEYAYMVATQNLNLQPNQQVLSFEFELEHPFYNVHTFEINHDGVSFLAGKLASVKPNALIIAGHRNSLLNQVIEEFQDGYGNRGHLEVVELSKQYDGFNMPAKAKEIAQQHKDDFILPLAGLSNNGVYEFLNECAPTDQVISSGMDIDCNSYNNRIAFSYMVNIDKAVDLHIQSWYDGKPWPNPNMGLAEGMTEIRMNPNFTEVGGVTKADLEKIYKDNLAEAILKDKE